jgi:hypothetical protein
MKSFTEIHRNFPRYIVWSTDRIDMNDPFQRRWYLRQVLLHGKAQDIRELDLDDVEQELDSLDLPAEIDRLWRGFLEYHHASQ